MSESSWAGAGVVAAHREGVASMVVTWQDWQSQHLVGVQGSKWALLCKVQVGGSLLNHMLCEPGFGVRDPFLQSSTASCSEPGGGNANAAHHHQAVGASESAGFHPCSSQGCTHHCPHKRFRESA